MESMDLDLDDIMEPVEDIDDMDDLPVASALPAFDDGDGNLLDTSAQQNDGLLDTLLDPGGGEQEGEAPAKRVVNRKPIPKLDPVRLTGERGLPALMKHFEKVRFRGKGHEVGDLDLLMRTLEHWAHRMFPKMPFDDVIERVEKLGSKKPVQTCLKKIRLDMPLLDDDFVVRGEDEVIPVAEDGEKPADGVDDIFPAPSLDATQEPSAVNVDTPKISMTDEQRQRIERNKRLAMERRLARQGNGAASSQQQAGSQATGLNDPELDDLVTMETGRNPTSANEAEGIDSEEEEAERMMWSQLMGGTSRKNEKEKEQESKRGKESEIHEIDSDDAEMENEIWNQMTEPIPTPTQQAAQETEMPTTTSRKKRRVIIDDDDDEDDDVVTVEKVESDTDVCNEMTEPILSQSLKDSSQKETDVGPETSAKKSRVISIDDDDSDDAEMENEIWNQMTEPVPATPGKSCSDSQPLKSSHVDGAIPGDRIAGVDRCHRRTELEESMAGGQSQGQKPDHDGMKTAQLPADEDDVSLNDSSMWTQITSSCPGDELPSTASSLQKDDLEGSSGMGSDSSKGQEKDICDEMTEPIPSQTQEAEISTARSRKKRKIIIDDDDDQEDDDAITLEKKEGEIDVCIEMTEPIPSQSLEDLRQKETDVGPETCAKKKSRVVNDDDDEDDGTAPAHLPADEDDIDFNDSSVWTQITSSLPEGGLPSSPGKEAEDGAGLPSIVEAKGTPEESGSQRRDKDNDLDSQSEEEQEINAPVISKKRKLIIDDDDNDD